MASGSDSGTPAADQAGGGVTLADLFATAVVDLGFRPDDFWSLTLPMYLRLLKKHTEVKRESWAQTGLIVATLVNINRKEGKPPVTPDDFNPYSAKKMAAGGVKRDSPEVLLKKIEAIHRQLGGKPRMRKE